ncbi:MAG: hypothetical protein P8K80_04710 [Phycisphaerales bacterium]|nr:hypothetical protein [Phycisphaerales bacterium]
MECITTAFALSCVSAMTSGQVSRCDSCLGDIDMVGTVEIDDLPTATGRSRQGSC